MATNTNEDKLENLENSDIEDIADLLDKGNIIPCYEKNLGHVNACILKFEKLQIGWCENWVEGKIDEKRLLFHFEKLKSEFQRGIKVYQRIILRKQEIKYMLYKIMTLNDRVKELEEEKFLKKAVRIGMAVTEVLFQNIKQLYGVCKDLINGDVCSTDILDVISAGGIWAFITNISQKVEEKIQFKQLKSLYDSFDDEFFGNLQAKHDTLESVLEVIKEKVDELDRNLVTGIFFNVFYGQKKELESKTQLSEEKINDIAKHAAKSACETHLRYTCSAEKIKEILSGIEKLLN